MFELLLTIIQAVAIPLVTVALLALYLRRTLPIILEEVGASIGEQFSAIFEKPAVKQAMTIMGKKSGDVRADKALREKVSSKLVENVPSINYVLEQLDITPSEGLSLLHDPIIGPIIQGALKKAQSGILQGNRSGPANSPNTKNFRVVRD